MLPGSVKLLRRPELEQEHSLGEFIWCFGWQGNSESLYADQNDSERRFVDILPCLPLLFSQLPFCLQGAESDTGESQSSLRRSSLKQRESLLPRDGCWVGTRELSFDVVDFLQWVPVYFRCVYFLHPRASFLQLSLFKILKGKQVCPIYHKSCI